MSSLRSGPGVGDTRRASVRPTARHPVEPVLLPLLVLTPLLAALRPGGDGALAIATDALGLVVGAAMLAAAGCARLHGQITTGAASGRLALLLAAAAVPTLALGVLAPPHLGLLLAVLTATTAFLVGRLDELTEWRRGPMVAALLLVGVGSPLGGLPALSTGLAGAALLAGTAAAALRRAVDTDAERRTDLLGRLLAAEEALREDRARLHEIDATVAGIAGAEQLVRDGRAADRTDALTAMMHAELERLQRLLAERAPRSRHGVDLDEVVGQIVTAHRARGRRVSWEPCGLRATGRYDDIAEIVNVLLENAAVHGGPGRIVVRAGPEATGAGVTLTVSDRGPGVPPGLRDRIFEWGVSGPGSPGRGIGLHVAGHLAHELGGRLELLASVHGASFAVHLPGAPREVTARDRVPHAS